MIVNGLVISLLYGIDRSVSSFVWGETKTTNITFGVRHPVGQPWLKIISAKVSVLLVRLGSMGSISYSMKYWLVFFGIPLLDHCKML